MNGESNDIQNAYSDLEFRIQQDKKYFPMYGAIGGVGITFPSSALTFMGNYDMGGITEQYLAIFGATVIGSALGYLGGRVVADIKGRFQRKKFWDDLDSSFKWGE